MNATAVLEVNSVEEVVVNELTVRQLIELLQKCDPEGVVCECNNGGATPFSNRASHFKVRQNPPLADKDWDGTTQSYVNHRTVTYVELGRFSSHTECRDENSSYFVPFIRS